MIFSQLESEARRFFRKEERFLLIEIERESIAVSQVFVRWGDKKIRIARTWNSRTSWVENQATAEVFLKKICDGLMWFQKYKIVVTAEPRIVTTVHTSAKIIRQENQKPIDEADMENFVSQAIWQVFDRHRMWSAQKMGVGELDLILADVKIRSFHIDEHRVLRPVGFPSRLVEVFLSQTFVPRGFLETIRALLSRSNNVCISEAGISGAEIIMRSEKRRGFSVVQLGSLTSTVYAVRVAGASIEKASYVDTFNIGFYDLYANFGKRLCVSPEIARQVIVRYFNRDISPVFEKKIENILKQEWALFCDGVASVLSENRDTKDIPNIPAFVWTSERLPEFLYQQRVRTKDKRRIELVALSLDTTLKQLGFEFPNKRGASFFGVAGLLDAYYYSDDSLNKLASRRLRWLMPPASEGRLIP